MATEVIFNHTNKLDLSTVELFARTTVSDLEETTIHNDVGNAAPHIYDNATASLNFNATNFTTTTVTQLLDRNVTAKVFELSTLHSENVTFTRETTSSQVVPSSSSSTFLPFVPVETSNIVEDSFNTTTSGFESTSGHFIDVDVQPAAPVGIAIGIAIGGFILLALIVGLIVYFVRKRRIVRKKESQVVMENPRYTLSGDSSLPRNFDLTMHTGPMMRTQINNNSAENLSGKNGKRKKEAPQPPIYRPLGGKDTGSKRKAPAPPKLGGVEYEDLYEKDSRTGSTEALELTSFLTANNDNADPVAADPEPTPSQPLFESFKPDKKSPKRSSKVDSGERPAAAADEDSIKQDDESKDEDEQMKTALLGKTKADSKLSLDSYDKAKNPFFGE